jgi:hypothetical protein
LRVSNERSFLLFVENRWLYELLTLFSEIPNKDALRSDGPKFAVFVAKVIDIFSVTDINLMRLPQKRVIPDFDKRVIANAKE